MDKRLFVGIGIIPDSVLANAIFKIKEALYESSILWEPTENLHITLKFIGNVPDSEIQNIENALETAAEFCEVFEIQFSGFGVFPNYKMPRIIWTGIEKPNSLTALNKEIEYNLKALGYKTEKQTFTPHLTLGRAKFIANLKKTESVLTVANYKTRAFKIEYFTLYESELTPSGAIYNELQRFYLK